MDRNQIKERVDRAVERLRYHDEILFEIDVHERTVTHKLGEYLNQEFPGWDVDCEYDRDTAEPKRLKNYKKDEDDDKKVYPDIIVHQRKCVSDENRSEGDEDNLLVAEVKTSSNDGRDIEKIEVFRDELGYQHGLFIDFQNYPEEKRVWKSEDTE